MYYAGICSFCEQGALGIRICSSENHALILCDECDAVWKSTDLSEKPVFPAQPDLPCPCCSGNLMVPPAHWASFGEIYQRGWISWVTGQTDD